MKEKAKPYITSDYGMWEAHVPEFPSSNFWGFTEYDTREYDTWNDAMKSVSHWYERGHLIPSSYRTTHNGRALKTCYCGK